MKQPMCLIMCFFLCGMPLFAEEEYQSGLTNVLRCFSADRRWERMHATNVIDSLIATTTNSGNIAECRLLKAAALIECAEVESDDAAYAEATNLCETVKSEYAERRDDWRLWGSILIGMQALAAVEQYTNAYAVATNAIALSPPADFERTTNVWCALFGEDIPSRISLMDAFKANAAMSLLMSDGNADISAYTNGLPARALEVIRAGCGGSEE